MADFIFNVAKGKVAYYAGLPASSDALVVVLLVSSGIDTDAVMKDLDTLDAVVTGSTEAAFTNYARKTITTGITVTVDDTDDEVKVDIGDITWSSAGGTSDETLGKLVVCYSGDTGTDTDTDIIPLTAHDVSATTNGTDLVAQIATGGFYVAS